METLHSDGVEPALLAEMQERADRAANGMRDPEAMCRARLRMDRMREEFYRRHGEVELAVELIREARES
jgi:hypothetical protein